MHYTAWKWMKEDENIFKIQTYAILLFYLKPSSTSYLDFDVQNFENFELDVRILRILR